MSEPLIDKTTLLRRVARPFVAGALATLPLALTLVVIFWLAGFIQRLLGPTSIFGKLLESIGVQFVTSKRVGYLIGLALALVLIYLFGLLVQSGMKARWHSMVDTVMNRVPLVNTVYDSSKKIIALFDRQGSSEMREMRPVMCYFGGKGGTAVLALMPSRKIVVLNGTEYRAVLVPSAPMPFTGALVYVPAEWVEPANIPLDGLVNIYMSMGVTSKDYLNGRDSLEIPAPREEKRDV